MDLNKEEWEGQRRARRRRRSRARANARKVEGDLAVGVELDLAPDVDEVLNTGRVEVGDGRKVEDDGAQSGPGVDRLDLVIGRLFAILLEPPDGTRAVPGPVAELGQALGLAAPRVGLDVVGQGVAVVRGVGEEERLAETVGEHAGRQRLDLDL